MNDVKEKWNNLYIQEKINKDWDSSSTIVPFIKKNCLSKQAVKDLIEVHMTEQNYGTSWANTWKKRLLKELGL